MLSTLISIAVTLPLQAWLVVIVVGKKQHHRFGFFTAYTAYSILAALLRCLLLLVRPSAYTSVFWLTEIPYAGLGVAAICEAFNDTIQPFYAMRRFRLVLPVTALLMLAMAVLHVLQNPPVERGRLWDMILAVNIMVRNIQVGIFILLAALMGFFHIPRRQHGVGIVNGFGVAAFGMLVFTVIRSKYGTKLLLLSEYGQVVTYLLAVVIWLRTFRGEERIASPYGTPADELIDEVKRYREVVKRHSK